MISISLWGLQEWESDSTEADNKRQDISRESHQLKFGILARSPLRFGSLTCVLAFLLCCLFERLCSTVVKNVEVFAVWLQLRHMEVPRAGIKSKLQLCQCQVLNPLCHSGNSKNVGLLCWELWSSLVAKHCHCCGSDHCSGAGLIPGLETFACKKKKKRVCEFRISGVASWLCLFLAVSGL